MILVSIVSYFITGPSHDKLVVCYISTWAVYRPTKGQFNLDNIDPNLCTHAIYAFSGLDATSDTIKSMGNFPKIVILFKYLSRIATCLLNVTHCVS